MKRLLFAALLFALPAHAQQANVVTACGSTAPFGAPAPGGQFFPTVDPQGRLCLSTAGMQLLADRLDEVEARLKALEGKR